MPSKEQIEALVQRLPELDVTPTPPPQEQEKPPERGMPKVDPRHFKGKLTGPAWPEAAAIYDELLAGGSEAVGLLIDLIPEHDTGPLYKARYMLHGLAVYVCQPGKQARREQVIQGIISRLSSPTPAFRVSILIAMLQTCGDATALPALAGMLSNELHCDAAATAMASIGGNASTLLGRALSSLQGRPRLAVIQALGTLRDEVAVAALISASKDRDEDTRLTALWALSRSGSAAAVRPIVEACAASDEGWARNQVTRAAMLLAETLATAGSRDAARHLYQQVLATRKGDQEAHIREAAERGIARLD